jgi:tetratricopeptide (TPR) repeat protein
MNKLHIHIVLVSILFSSVATAQEYRRETRKGIRDYNNQSYKDAEEHYFNALEASPNYTTAENNLGSNYYRQDNYESAVQHYNNAVSYASDDEELEQSLYNLGNAYLQTTKV